MEYLESFLEKAKKLLPEWMVKQIHDEAVPQSGGKARAKSHHLESDDEEVNKILKDIRQRVAQLNNSVTEMVEKAVVDYQDLPLAARDREWDGDEAEQNLREWASDGEVNKENMDWEKYRRGFLYYDPENEENFGAYKFAIADIVDGELTAIPQGIFAAAAILSGAMLEEGAAGLDVGQGDVDDMKSHLSSYYNKMAQEFEDDSLIAPWDKEAAKKKFKFKSSIMKKEHDKKLVYGVVLEPEEVDAQGDIMSAKEIEKAAHFFLLNSQVVGASHEDKAAAKIAQSYIAPVDFELNGQLVKKGSWILVTKVLDDKLWKKIKNGKYNSYSVGGYGVREEINIAM